MPARAGCRDPPTPRSSRAMRRERSVLCPLARLALALVACAALAGPARADDFPSFFRGVVVPMLTPYEEGNVQAVDHAALRAFTRWLCERRVSALFPVSGLGQWELLALEEKKRVVSTVIAAAQGCKPVVAGIGGESVAETLELGRHAVAQGASALAVVTPAFLRGSAPLAQDILLRYYGEIAGALPREVPLLLYDAKGELAPPTLRALASAHPNIRAMKFRSDSSTDMARMVLAAGDRVAVLTGIESNTLATLSLGGVGVIGGGANAFPDLLAEIVERFAARDLEGALRAQRRAMELYDALESSAQIKYLLRELAGIPIAYSQRAGAPGRIVEKDLPRDPEQLARLKQSLAEVMRPARSAE
jgi:dihydrodipicolinate synthase/N-acetylneuraminate lyase